MHATQRNRGFTAIEMFTVLIVISVLTAIAVPMWRRHLLRVQRADAIASLTTLAAAQDRFFGRNARYADGAQIAANPPAGLGLKTSSEHGFYSLEVRAAADGLSYLATARVIASQGQAADTRCVEFSIDHVGIRRAVDDSGADRSADCWR